ncbi:MAG TPA: condensation domain-containing protein, partial [Thermoanaerobaculia bacterium]|nr:condensation domain-containing protein [Thermoanaerobaculia bacterium]
LGRIDQQVKVRGFRIEPGEVEAALLGCPGVAAAAVVVQRHGTGDERLVAYVAGEAGLRSAELRRFAESRLPSYMVPSRFVCLDRLPLTRHGKVDRRALSELETQKAAEESAALQAQALPAGLEGLVTAVFQEVLGVEKVGLGDNFFDLGGHSLLLAEVQSRLSKQLGEEVPLLEIYRNPNVGALARALAARRQPALAEAAVVEPPARPGERAVAIIGMAGRFPGAADLSAFWRNLRDGIESISFFTDFELDRDGVSRELRRHPGYVPAAGVLADAELFDAGFFDIGPREAQVMDPQQRVLLECAAEALESAGYGAGSPAAEVVRIGVFAGGGTSTYALNNLVGHPDLDALEMSLGNDKDFLATRLSYKLDLKGPALTVQTACSTSLVAVHLAVRSLLDGECDLAVAGGVGVSSSQTEGYVYQEGGVASPDGHNRAFEARAKGTVNGNGAGVVVLKPLARAVADGDPIHAVVLGSALNNDGAGKVGFTAPSEEGQAKAIAAAQAAAGVSPEGIGYVEAHGSATPVGDPIEIAALTRAFRAGTARQGFCAVGSVKTNIGHTGSAAGIAGLLKAVLALEHRQIPASLHYERPNPRIDFASSPFYVNRELAEWPAGEGPRRAGVSSFGLGGTNVHVIVEEAPARPETEPSRPWQPLVLSARTETALEAVTDRLVAHLAEHPEEDLADVAATLATGRKGHAWRRAVVCRDGRDAREVLAARDPRRLLSGTVDGASRPVAFLFSGLGEQYPAMAAGLYRDEPAFRERLDRYAAALAPVLGVDPLAVLFAGADREEAETAAVGPDLRRMLGRAGSGTGGASREAERLARTAVSQPVLFAVELALAGLWREWGIEPQAMLGYSLGEYVAACVAGVFSAEDALRLVAERARRIDALPAGAMLAVPLASEELRPLLAGDVWVAAVNGPRLTVVSGTPQAVAELAPRLGAHGIASRPLATTHAFHCPLLEPVAAALVDLLHQVPLAAPRIPYLSNLTGTWITASQATDPDYWAAQLCRPVQFASGVAELWREPGRVLLEIGPGASLSSLALQQAAGSAAAADPVAVSSLPGAYERQPDCAHLLGTVAKLWLSGVRLDWRAVWGRERRRRLPLPSYPFERRRYWIERMGPALGQVPPLVVLVKETGLGESIAARLRQAGARVMEVTAGDDNVDVDIDRLLAALGLEGRPELVSASPQSTGGFPGTLHGRPNLKNPYVAPESEIERHLAVIWQELLGIDPIGVHDSFFDLGGDSLQAVQVIARVRGAWGVEIGPGALFEAPTPQTLAAAVQALQPAGETAAGKPEIVPVPRQEAADLPLSFAQQRMWFIDELEGGPLYNVPLALRVSGELSVAVLSRVLGEVVRRHEALRTVFPGVEGRARQVILPPAGCAVPLVDLTGLAPALRQPMAEALVKEDVRRPFDLARGPLLRAGLWRLGEGEHVLLLNLHHIVSDGWSLGVLMREMSALYAAFAAGQPSPLAELPVQYADFAAWQRSWLAGGVLEGELQYWRDRLAGAPPVLDLPADRPRPAVQSFRGADRFLTLPPELSEALTALSRREGATLFMTLVSALGVLLSRFSGQADLTLGTPVAGRHHLETESLIGLFVNTLVLRHDLSAEPCFTELLSRVRREALAAYAHQDLPFEKLVEDLAPERSLAHSPLFQVLFAWQNLAVGEIALPGLRLVPLELLEEGAKFDLSLSLHEVGSGIAGSISYARDLFDAPTIDRLATAYSALLSAVVEQPELPVSQLSLLGSLERHQLLVEWNDVAALAPADTTLHGLFAAQAARTPQAVALVEGSTGERWTYRELDLWSDSLAYRLVDLGVGPEVRVGVCLPRTPLLVATLLGVLKAGGAYVPLDPEYPRERL